MGEVDMAYDVRKDIQNYAGKYLGEIGAEFVEAIQIRHGQVCRFRVGDRQIAISDSIHDGLSCRIGGPDDLPLSNYLSWPTLWHLLDMDKDVRGDVGLMDYLKMFPDGHADMLKFIGKSLKKYFSKDYGDSALN